MAIGRYYVVAAGKKIVNGPILLDSALAASWPLPGGQSLVTETALLADGGYAPIAAPADPADGLRQKAAAALSANAAFLALASPTNAQVVTHVQRLTRETNALIRLALSQFDDGSDT